MVTLTNEMCSPRREFEFGFSTKMLEVRLTTACAVSNPLSPASL